MNNRSWFSPGRIDPGSSDIIPLLSGIDKTNGRGYIMAACLFGAAGEVGDPNMSIVEVGIGFLTLVAGRPAYWVFVGGISFLVGEFFASQFALFSSFWNSLILSLLFALGGVLLTLPI